MNVELAYLEDYLRTIDRHPVNWIKVNDGYLIFEFELSRMDKDGL